MHRRSYYAEAINLMDLFGTSVYSALAEGRVHRQGCVQLCTMSTGSTANGVPIWTAVHCDSTVTNL